MHNLGKAKLTYVRSYVANPRLRVVSTSVQNRGGRGAIRTHFERLSSEEESLAHPKELPAPKRAKTFEDLCLSNEHKEGRGEKAAPARLSAGTADRATNSLGDSMSDLGLSFENTESQSLPRGSADDDPGLCSEDTESQSESESEEDEEVE